MEEAPKVALQADAAAQALNEQGYLLQMRVRQSLSPSPGGTLSVPWVLAAEEYPVTGGADQLARIDLVYRHANFGGLYAAIECKRPNPNFKHWLFFGPNPKPFGQFHSYIETLRSINSSDSNQHQHNIDDPLGNIPSYQFYLEATKDRHSGKFSHTETIEKTFRQVIVGQQGLLRKLADHVTRGSANRIVWLRVIPVVVTTAQLFVAEFDPDKVQLRNGNIEPTDLRLRELPYLSVDYHADDDLRLDSRFSKLTPGPDPANDIRLFQTRTIFVVQTGHLAEFLRECADIFVIRD